MVLQSDGQVSSMSISEAQQQGYSLTTTAHRVVLRSQYKQPRAELIMVGNHGGRKELHGFCITNTFNEKLATTDWRNTLRALPDGVLYNTKMFSKLFDALFMFTQVNFVSVAQLKCPPERADFRRVLQRVYCHAKCARGFGNGDKLQTPKFVHLTVQIYLAYSEYTYLISWSDIMLTKWGGKGLHLSWTLLASTGSPLQGSCGFGKFSALSFNPWVRRYRYRLSNWCFYLRREGLGTLFRICNIYVKCWTLR